MEAAKDHPIIECWKHTTVINMRPQMTAAEVAEIAQQLADGH